MPIGGTVSGLEGTGLVLRNNGGDELAVSRDGAFVFATPLAPGAAYAVTVEAQPSTPTQTCMVANGTGMAGADGVDDIAVTCVTGKFIVGGTVTGLAGSGLVLRNNGGDDVAVNADGTFNFPTPLASGTAFAVTVATQPSDPTQTCTVAGGTGTVGAAPISTIVVDCAVDRFAVGGVVAGLDGTVVLQNNGGDDIAVTANGTFAFPTTVASGDAYAVTVRTHPTSPIAQTCTVTSGAGNVGSTDVTTVRVDCATDAFTVGGTVNGLAGAGLVLQLGTETLAVGAAGAFTFPTPLASGTTYAVTVLAQPAGPSQTCTVANGSGTVGAAAVTDVTVTCATETFTIGGTVSGLVGSGLVLRNNGGDDLAIAGDGAFTFAAPVASGAAFAVTIHAQPAGPTQTCTVSGGAGTVGAADVSSVAIHCATDAFAIGGTVSGLAGTLVLRNNGGDDLTLTTNGDFAFATPIASGGAYAVTVGTQPGSPSQTCTITNGSGSVGAAAVTTVVVACVTNTFTIGGTISGLAGSGLVLRNNAGDDLAIGDNGAFTFGTAVASGDAYAVTVATQPTNPSQTCSVTAGTGVVGGANVTNVAVACTTDTFRVGGTVTGLVGSGLVLQNNGGDDVLVAGDGTFSFPARVASGGGYAATVLVQPTNPSQTCTVAAATGTVTDADITSIAVTCTTNAFAIGGVVSGLAGSGLVLRNNGADDLAIAADGTFTFSTPVSSGAPFAVTVATQPASPTQTCTVVGGTGTVGSGAVTSVMVDCTTDRFAIGGTITGLTGTVVLQNNGGDDLTLTANGAFAFPTTIASASAYAVTVLTQPTSPVSQTCTVAAGSGTVGSTDVTSVAIACTTNSFTIGGALSGLAAGNTVVLRKNGADDLALDTNGPFAFATPVASGTPYTVTVLTNPDAPLSQTCEVTAGTGTVTTANITDVAVTCTTNTFSVGGSVTGLEGTGLVLALGGQTVTLAPAATTFTFPTPLESGTAYAVTVSADPSAPTQSCTVTAGGTGTIANADVTDVAVTCTTSLFTVGGTVTGLAGSGLELALNGEPLGVTAGTFVFPSSLPSGTAYEVTVVTQPSAPTQGCTVAAGTGTIADANVTDVVVTCATSSFTVGGTVTGLTGSGLVLRNNGVDDLAIGMNGPFTFATPVASGGTYAVTIAAQPSGQTCSVSSGDGTVGGAPVTSVVVNCAANLFTIGGTVSGLVGTVVLQNNLGDDLAINANGSFTFPASIASGDAYAVTVLTNPSGQTCTVANGTGTVGGDNVTTVTVTCATNTFTVGGTVNGLTGAGLVLQNNGGDDLPIATDGAFVFATALATGAGYDVTVGTQPTGQTCTVGGGTGTVGGDVTSVVVSCTTNAFTVGGTVTGLTDAGLVLALGGETLPVPAGATSFVFATALPAGTPYAVTIEAVPSGQTCSFAPGTDTGTIVDANVTSVEVICAGP